MKPNVEPFTVDDPELLELVSLEMHAWLNSWPSRMKVKYGGQYVAVGRERRVLAYACNHVTIRHR